MKKSKSKPKSTERATKADTVESRNRSKKGKHRSRPVSDAEFAKIEPLGERHVEKRVRSRRLAPLPPPAELAAYEEILPGMADRLVRNIERSTKVRLIAVWASHALAFFLIAIVGIATWHGNPMIAVPMGLFSVLPTLVRSWFDSGRAGAD